MSKDFDPHDCVGGLCPPNNLPLSLRHHDHTVWSRAPGEIWWRRQYYATKEVADGLAAENQVKNPDTEYVVRPNNLGPPENS